MKSMTATEASRRFSDLLDAVEAGESFTLSRGNRIVAEIRPAQRRRGSDLHAALAGIEAPDEAFVDSIAEAVADLEEGGDPWGAR